MERERAGTIGWACIGAFVLAWDILAPESLTHAFSRGVENPHTRPFVLGALAVTAAHLVDAIPHRYDPFYAVINR
jgi:hypothetical protein